MAERLAVIAKIVLIFKMIVFFFSPGITLWTVIASTNCRAADELWGEHPISHFPLISI